MGGLRGMQSAKCMVIDGNIIIKPSFQLHFLGSNISKFIEFRPGEFVVALNSKDLYIMNLLPDRKEINYPVKKYGPKAKVDSNKNNKSICHELLLLEISNKYVLYRDDKSLSMIDTSDFNKKKKEFTYMYPIYTN